MTANHTATRVTKYLRVSPTSDLQGRRFRMGVLTDFGLFEGSAGRSRTSPARGYCWAIAPSRRWRELKDARRFTEDDEASKSSSRSGI